MEEEPAISGRLFELLSGLSSVTRKCVLKGNGSFLLDPRSSDDIFCSSAVLLIGNHWSIFRNGITSSVENGSGLLGNWIGLCGQHVRHVPRRRHHSCLCSLLFLLDPMECASTFGNCQLYLH